MKSRFLLMDLFERQKGFSMIFGLILADGRPWNTTQSQPEIPGQLCRIDGRYCIGTAVQEKKEQHHIFSGSSHPINAGPGQDPEVQNLPEGFSISGMGRTDPALKAEPGERLKEPRGRRLFIS